MSEAKCIESRVHCGGDGKVAIMEYGKVTSGYGANISRTYAIPEDWTEEQLSDFEDQVYYGLKVRVDEILDHEFNERWSQRVWESEQ